MRSVFTWIFLSVQVFRIIVAYKTKVYTVDLPSESASLLSIEPQNAINVQFIFTASRAVHILRFIPAVLWRQSDTCSNRSETIGLSSANRTHPVDLPLSSLWSPSPMQPTTNQTQIQPLNLANVTYLSNRTEDQVLPLELWADRSVLVFTIRSLDFRNLFRHTRDCGRIRICSIPRNLVTVVNLANASMDLLCNTALKKIMLSCADEEETFHPLILPLAHGLALEVDGLGSKAEEYRPSLTITASSGYSLPAGVFCCPNGMFACSPPSRTTPILNYSWEQRICMPSGLRCDGTTNCPIGDSDEQNCSAPNPTHFDSTVEDELGRFIAYLHTIRPARLVLEAGYTNSVFGAALYQSRLSWYILAVLTIIVLIVFVITLLLLIRCVCRRRAKRLKKDGVRHKWPAENSSVDSGSRPVSRPHSEPDVSDTNDNNSLLRTGRDSSWVGNEHPVGTRDNSLQIRQPEPVKNHAFHDHLTNNCRKDGTVQPDRFQPTFVNV